MSVCVVWGGPPLTFETDLFAPPDFRRGFDASTALDPDTIGMRTAILKTTIDQLIEDETRLDRQCHHIRLELQHAQRNPSNAYFAYVTRDDLIDCFGDNVVLTMRDFDFYETDVSGAMAKELRVVSQNTPVEVRLVTQEGDVYNTEASGCGKLLFRSVDNSYFVVPTKTDFRQR